MSVKKVYLILNKATSIWIHTLDFDCKKRVGSDTSSRRVSVTDSVAGCSRDLRSVQETTGKIEHAVCFQVSNTGFACFGWPYCDAWKRETRITNEYTLIIPASANCSFCVINCQSNECFITIYKTVLWWITYSTTDRGVIFCFNSLLFLRNTLVPCYCVHITIAQEHNGTGPVV